MQFLPQALNTLILDGSLPHISEILRITVMIITIKNCHNDNNHNNRQKNTNNNDNDTGVGPGPRKMGPGWTRVGRGGTRVDLVGRGWDPVDPVGPTKTWMGEDGKTWEPDARRQDPVLYSVLLIFVATVINMEARNRPKYEAVKQSPSSKVSPEQSS